MNTSIAQSCPICKLPWNARRHPWLVQETSVRLDRGYSSPIVPSAGGVMGRARRLMADEGMLEQSGHHACPLSLLPASSYDRMNEYGTASAPVLSSHLPAELIDVGQAGITREASEGCRDLLGAAAPTVVACGPQRSATLPETHQSPRSIHPVSE